MRPTYASSRPAASSGVGNTPFSGSSISVTPGAAASSDRASATSIARENVARIATAWPVTTGTRTLVASTSRSGADRIFFGSAIILSSSPVKPPASNSPICGTTLNAIGRENTSPVGSASRSGWASASTCPPSFSICSASSRVPFWPAPLTAWYDDSTSDRSPAARCSGPTASTAAIVVQFGTAMMPGFGHPSSASGFTSATTSGHAGSIRNALELSTQTVPCASTIPGKNERDVDAPADTNATSTPAAASTDSSRTSTSRPANGTVRPALRAEANGTNSSTANRRSSKIRAISRPTAPVAPITATFIRPSYRRPSSNLPLTSSDLRDRGVQPEALVHDLERSIAVGSTDHARHPDRRRGDHLDVDALGREGVEHVARHAGVRLHPGPDEGNLRDVVVDREPLGADLGGERLESRTEPLQIGPGRRERQVGGVLVRDVLHDHVDVHALGRDRLEDARRHAGPVRHVVDRHLRLLGIERDPADQHAFHLFLAPLRHPCTGGVVERRANVDLDAVSPSHLDGTRLQHLRARRRELQHLVVAHHVDLARTRDDPRIGREHPVDVGVDLTDVGADRAGHRDGGEVGSTAAERRDLVVARQTLEPRP